MRWCSSTPPAAIVLWNHGAERLTGIDSAGVRGQTWHPALLGVADEQGRVIGEADCPVHTAIRCGAQSLRRLTIVGRGQRPMAVDTHAIPAVDRQGVTQGAVLLFHDASSEISLEQRCQSLHEKATQGPAYAGRQPGRVRPRARDVRRRPPAAAGPVQPDDVRPRPLQAGQRHLRPPGGRRGDQEPGTLLKSSCRPGDLVARYGGEEFVMLCADCDNATATRRAEQNRKALSQLAQPRMDGRSVTVSFGVTEIQPGDTAETMLRRADRALLMAKANGRNTVVQLGGGSRRSEAEIGQPGSRGRSIWPKGPRTSSNRTWSRPCRSRSPSKSCGASWPIIRPGSWPSTATTCGWRSTASLAPDCVV